MSNQQIFFPGLNSVRCLAVTLVIFTHIESFKQKSGLQSLLNNDSLKDFIGGLGRQGVIIFFTLSGFLITYLLLVEKKTILTIEIKKFYIRRILRIWPLYFTIVILGFFILPHILSPDYFAVKPTPHLLQKLLLTIFFLPNAVLIIYGSIFSIGVLWSIGVEEQFYLFWPHFIKRFKLSQLFKAFTVLLIALVTLKTGLWLILNSIIPIPSLYGISKLLYQFLHYDSMLIGAFCALIYFNKTLNKVLYTTFVQLMVIVFILLFWANSNIFGPFANTVASILYGILILNISTNRNTLIKGTPMFEYVGKISYGMYLFHSIAIAFFLRLFGHFTSLTNLQFNFLLYILVFGSTILISALSYTFFEKPILNYKKRYMVVQSSNSK